MLCKQKNGNPKKETNRNARLQRKKNNYKAVTKIKNAFSGIISKVDTTEGRILA